MTGGHHDTLEAACSAVLAKLADSSRPLETEDLSSLLPFQELMPVLAELEQRGWVRFANRLHGDDRLMSVRAISITADGQSALRDQLVAAVDLYVSAQPDVAPSPGLVKSLPALEDKRLARARFVEGLYDRSGGDPGRSVDAAELGLALGFARGVTAELVRYLTNEGLVERSGWGSVAISHAGVKEVEQLLESPEAPTAHFPPHSYVIIAGDNYGQVQAGTVASHQTQVTSETVAVGAFLDALEHALPESGTDAATAALVIANIAEVREALASEGHEAPLVRRLMPFLKDFGVNMAASGAFLGLTEAASHLPPFS